MALASHLAAVKFPINHSVNLACYSAHLITIPCQGVLLVLDPQRTPPTNGNSHAALLQLHLKSCKLQLRWPLERTQFFKAFLFFTCKDKMGLYSVWLRFKLMENNSGPCNGNTTPYSRGSPSFCFDFWLEPCTKTWGHCSYYKLVQKRTFFFFTVQNRTYSS